ncbi:NADH oxidoreductase [Enterobacteriaceae bacterium LUAb1]
MQTPVSLCPHPMMVHHIHQETHDVWTLALICHDNYSWQAGQFALVSINNSETLRAYTLSSSPGVSTFITLTIRRVPDGAGSVWLTRDVKRGDTLWLSEAQGTFTLTHYPDTHYLLLAGGCGVTPVMAMRRWLARFRPDIDVKVIYCIRSPQDVIFATEWTHYPHTLICEEGTLPGAVSGRLTGEILAAVPDLSKRTVLCCGPNPFMAFAEEQLKQLGVMRYACEYFTPISADVSQEAHTIRTQSPVRHFSAAAGASLLEAMENHQIPINAACRAGVCGCCKVQVLSGEYQLTTQGPLTEQERQEGYVLACRCYPQSDMLLA